MTKRHLIILISIIIVTSCHTRKQSSGENSIDRFDVKQTIDLALNVALINFENSDYSIYPYFHAGIADSTFYKSFAEKNSGIKISSQQMLNLIGQYREKEGAELRRYIINENKTNRLSESYFNINLSV